MSPWCHPLNSPEGPLDSCLISEASPTPSSHPAHGASAHAVLWLTMWPVVAAVLLQDLPALLQPLRDCSPAGQGGVYGGDPILREQLSLPPPSSLGPECVQWPTGTVVG